MQREMTIQSAGKQRRLLEWSQRVIDCRQSGMTVKSWCEENGIVPKTYYRWQKKVFAEMVEQRRLQLEETPESVERICFAELPAPERIPAPYTEPPKLAASIRMGSASIDLYSGADPEIVRMLCREIRSC